MNLMNIVTSDNITVSNYFILTVHAMDAEHVMICVTDEGGEDTWYVCRGMGMVEGGCAKLINIKVPFDIMEALMTANFNPDILYVEL